MFFRFKYNQTLYFLQNHPKSRQIPGESFRKTFGYHARMKGVSIELIQKLFNHSAPSVTMKYIGITQDELVNVYFNLNL
jgi:site-specific recombinase XerD